MPSNLINPQQVLKQMAAILRPVIRLCIKAGVTYPALSELLKEVYVQVADREFSLPGKDQTDSRLAVITGVHRREIRRLREIGTPVSVIPASASISSLLISRWLADQEFSLPDGRPRPLSRTGEGGKLGFDDLVESVTKDVRPRAIFDDWSDRGIISVDANGLIHLAVELYGPNGDDDERFYYFGRNLRDHIESAVANVTSEGRSPFFERAVHYDSLSENASQQLMQKSNTAAMTILKQVNAQAHEVVSDKTQDGEWRFTLGVYVFREKRRE
jgi:hypothetical protein